MKTWHTAIAITVIGIFTIGTISLLKNGTDSTEISQSKTESTTSVQTLTLTSQAFQPEIRLLGQIVPARQIELVSELSSHIKKEHVSRGDIVEKGEILLTLDDFAAQQNLAQARADIADIETRILLFSSQQRLNEQAVTVEKSALILLQEKLKQHQAVGASPQTIADVKQQIARQTLLLEQAITTVETAPLSLQQLNLQKEKLQLALNSAQRLLTKTNVTAPFSGQISLLHVAQGQAINQGQMLVTLVSHEDMLAKVSVPVALANQRTNLSGFVSQQKRQSPVSYRYGDAQLLPGSAGLTSWFELADDQQWITGEIVELTLRKPAVPGTFKIPVSALFQDKWIYTVNAEQRLESLEVQLHGRIRESNEEWLIISLASDYLNNPRILTTRLNNPTAGLKIFERGVDPEPIALIEPDEDNAEISDEQDEAGK
jgi:multidrug efflux pump subunit AcrA (membrane-fusion protein)